MKYSKLIHIILSFFSLSLFSNDTIYIQSQNDNLSFSDNLYIFYEVDQKIEIEQLISNPSKYSFKKSTVDNLNFGFRQKGIWIKFTIKNLCENHVNYILSISNPDLQFLDFYKVFERNLVQKINTGQTMGISSRSIPNRNYLFEIQLNPGAACTYYIYTFNKGDSIFIPFNIASQQKFFRSDNISLTFISLCYGLLIFMIFFNLYLFYSSKERINLYYCLHLLFFTFFNATVDGFFYLTDNITFLKIFSYIKWFPPVIAIFCLIPFSQNFLEISHSKNFLNKFLNFLKTASLSTLLFVFIPIYPINILPNIILGIVYVATNIVIILASIKEYNKNYIPNRLFLIAFLFMMVAALVYVIRDTGFLPSNVFLNNSIRIGLVAQGGILTIAVLERFRIQQEQAKKTIEDSYGKIEIQNKELEIINAELEKLSIVASETNNSVAIYDKGGRLEWCNTHFEKFYRTTLNELIKNKKDNFENIVLTDNKSGDLFNKCLKDKTPLTFEWQVHPDDKEEIWVQTTLSPLVNRGIVYKLVAIDSDITKLKQYERNLELAKEKAIESDKLKTVFLGNMSHEIRTPLNGIMGFSDLLANTKVDEERKMKYLKMITSNGEQLLRIIDDIVDISLIEANQLRIYPTSFNLDHFLQDIIDFFEVYKTTINKPAVSIKLKNKLLPAERNIIADAIRLKQVISNLIHNGLKFTKEGCIRIECSKKDTNIQFCIEDTGIGLDPSKKDIIFEHFRQADERLNREYGGTGLGLSISKGIVDKMNGKIWIDSNYTDGLKICFSIPYVSPDGLKSTNATEIKKEIKALLGDKNILVVEDHDDSYELLKEILSPQNPQIRRVYNGQEAVNMVRNYNFDLVLMDINLPVLDGIAATREIRKINSNIAVIAQTAHALDIEREKILSSGCNDIITKPITSSDLFRLLEKYI